MVIMLQFLPDSPRWLLIRDRVEDAQEALRRFLGTNLDRSDPLVLNELASISGALAIERRVKLNFKDVILRRDRSGHFKRMLLGCGTQFMQVRVNVCYWLLSLTYSQQFGGINALNYYFPTILENALGMSELMARILTGCNATSYAISSALAFWLIDRVGRRSLMMNGAFFQFFAYVMVAISVAMLSHAPSQVS